MAYQPKKCRSCGAEILWVVTVNDKKMPVDPKPEKRIVLSAGPTGNTPRADVVDTYLSHYASCPHADGWRKR